MITLARIQGPSMGFANFQKPVIQRPHRMGLDISLPPMPQFPPLDLPLDAGSLAPADGGGADGGDAPAPAPLPGGDAVTLPGEAVPPGYYPPQPTYLFPVQEVPTPAAPTPTPTSTPAAPAVPTWAIVGGALVAGIVLAKLL